MSLETGLLVEAFYVYSKNCCCPLLAHQLAACMSGAHHVHLGFGCLGMMFVLLFVHTPFDCSVAESARKATNKNTRSPV